MKKRIGIVFFFILVSLQTLRADCAYTPLFETLYRTPVIVYGTVKNIKSQGEQNGATLLIETVFKGNLQAKTIEIAIFNTQKSPSNINENDKRVYFLAQNQAKKWEILPARCITNSLFVNNRNEIEFNEKKVASFADFKEGLALLAKNYEALHNYSKQRIANDSNNQTFAFLIDQIEGRQPPISVIKANPKTEGVIFKKKKRKR